MTKKQDVNIFEELACISGCIMAKEQEYASMYNIAAPEEVKKEFLDAMLVVDQKINEYNFMQKMKQGNLESVVQLVQVEDIKATIGALIEKAKENYYYYEIISSVNSFLEELKNKFNTKAYDQLYISLKLHSYVISLEYQRNIRIKEHPEYSKIEQFVKCRERIIKFFHNKWKYEDYVLEELEELKELLLDYENHMDDIKNITDDKIKSIIYQEFFDKYDKKLDTLFFVNGTFTS